MATKNRAIYPGSFDPLTNGHVSIIRRGARIFDELFVSIAGENSKNSLFSLDDRVEMARITFADTPGVIVEPFRGLLVDYAKQKGATVVLRGLRAVSDFDYEFQMALMNRQLYADMETVFLVTDFRWMYISSTIIKEVAKLGGDVSQLVPPASLAALRRAYGHPETWPASLSGTPSVR